MLGGKGPNSYSSSKPILTRLLSGKGEVEGEID